MNIIERDTLPSALPIPITLLDNKEQETLKNVRYRVSYNSKLKCKIAHIEDKDLKSIVLSDNKALALRIVAKVIQIKGRSPEIKMSMLAVASALGAWAPTEADRIVRML